MISAIWNPFWYELDQSIVTGDIDIFFLSRDMHSFANGFASYDDCAVKAKIINIRHNELGAIKGIVTIGLDYSIYLHNTDVITVNAEESPGTISDNKYYVNDWSFHVDIEVIEECGYTSKEYLQMLGTEKRRENAKIQSSKYEQLLNFAPKNSYFAIFINCAIVG